MDAALAILTQIWINTYLQENDLSLSAIQHNAAVGESENAECEIRCFEKKALMGIYRNLKRRKQWLKAFFDAKLDLIGSL